jgi:hypothetical protein
MESYPLRGDDRQREITADIMGALQGIGPCDDGVT